MNSIKKKILTGILSATVLFSAFGFSACGNSEQAAKLAELELKLLQQQTQIADIAQEKDNLAEQLNAQIENLEEENEDLQSAINALEQQKQELEERIEQLEKLIKEPTIKEVLSDEMVDSLNYYYTPGYSYLGPAILVNHSDEDATFNFSVQKSYVLTGWKSGEFKNGSVKAGSGFWWRPPKSETPLNFKENDYIDVIIKSGETIIGYAVIEIYPVDIYGSDFRARNLICVSFPKIDGEYQNVTEEYVKDAIAKVKDE